MQSKKYLEIIAETGKRDFWYFCKEIIGLDLIEEIPHRKMCNDAMVWGKNKRDWLYPRDTFKTTILVVCYAIWEIVKNPNIKILLTSDSNNNSTKSLKAIKSIMESNNLFIDCYGDLKKEPGWTDTEITVATRNLSPSPREPTIMTGGVDSPRVGMHFDLILFDDPHNERLVTPEMIRKVIQYYQNLMPILDSRTGRMQITATRWAHLDIHNHIFTYEKEDFDIYISSALWDENGETKYFFPKRLTPEFLAKRKLSMGSYNFSLQYLNNPLDDENAPFKLDEFKHFNIKDDHDNQVKYIYLNEGTGKEKVLDFDELHFFISVDPAGRGTISELRLLDYSAFVIVAVDNDGNWYVVDAIRKKHMKPSEMIQQIIDLMLIYRPEVVGIESVTYQGQIKYDLDRRLEKMNLDSYTYVRELKHGNRQKANRILGLQPLYQSGRIYHRQNLLDLEDELIHWSLKSTKHDDIIDALAYIRDMVYEPEPGYSRRPPVPREHVELHESPGLQIAASECYSRSGKRQSFQDFLETWDPYEDGDE